jgi:mycoredoxin
MLFTIYTTPTCADCLRVKHYLKEHDYQVGRDFQEIDIAQNPKAIKKVEQLNNGYRSTPTLVFSDGSVLSEPPISLLEQKLNSLSR